MRKKDTVETTPLVEIIRIENNLSSGAFGVLKINGRSFCVTLERPWQNNAPFISCIPCGCYLMKRIESVNFQTTYEVQDVDNRTDILFHWGNYCIDSLGCILLGESYGIISGASYPMGKRGITNSQKTFRRFMRELKRAETVRLIIQEA